MGVQKNRQQMVQGPDGAPIMKSSTQQAGFGAGSDTNEVNNIVQCSQAAYDALGTPDPNTVYVIVS